jgi:octaprenyl-diphosphate synthase
MKSASTPECACQIGALLATENQQLTEKFTLFGRNLGMASQIGNDIQGIIRETDIKNRKITLPVIYSLTQTEGDVRDKLELAFIKSSEALPDPTYIRDMLFQCGAIHYATIKMELYKQQGLDILHEAAGLGANVERLKLFLK